MQASKLRTIFTCIVIIFFVHAPIERFFVPIMTFFPLYHWELGFGHISQYSKGKNLAENHVKRAVSLSAEKYCSASKMLEKSAEITHDYEISEV